MNPQGRDRPGQCCRHGTPGAGRNVAGAPARSPCLYIRCPDAYHRATEDGRSHRRVLRWHGPHGGSGRCTGNATRSRARSRPRARANITPDVVVADPSAARGTSGFLNERALLEMVAAVYHRVRASLAARRFPLIYSADCAVLLGAVPALRDVHGKAGLVFMDGHEHATPMELSASGEAANMELPCCWVSPVSRYRARCTAAFRPWTSRRWPCWDSATTPIAAR